MCAATYLVSFYKQSNVDGGKPIAHDAVEARLKSNCCQAGCNVCDQVLLGSSCSILLRGLDLLLVVARACAQPACLGGHQAPELLVNRGPGAGVCCCV
jgi:hypothetical protein